MQIQQGPTGLQSCGLFIYVNPSKYQVLMYLNPGNTDPFPPRYFEAKDKILI